MGRYDFIQSCQICGKTAAYINGQTNTDVVLIRTKRKTTNVYHRDCIEKEQRECARQRLTVSK